jgi:inorganic pyrophosphatase/exopolyphosphatase
MEYIILGHENPDVDSIISGYLLEKIMKKRGYDVSFIIPDKKVCKDTENICNEFNIFLGKYFNDDMDKNAKYILVDHNEREVPGEIVAVIDHHPCNIEYKCYFDVDDASSTAYKIASYAEEELSKKDIELAVLATFIDTVSFHSTKTRKSDISWVNEMCTKYEFEYDDLYRHGLCLTDLKNVEDIMFNGLKKYDFDGFKIHCSYLQVEDISKHSELIDEMIDKLKSYYIDNDISLFVFIIYDMSCFHTKVYEINEDVDTREYNLYASRGNTIITDIKKDYCDKYFFLII